MACNDIELDVLLFIINDYEYEVLMLANILNVLDANVIFKVFFFILFKVNLQNF